MRSIRLLAPVALLLLAGTTRLVAATIDVGSMDQLQRAIDRASPGDRIVVADGQYPTTAPITISQAATADQPIIIEAKSTGGVTFTGDAGFRIQSPAAYVVIRGFVFANNASESGGASVIEAGAHHCRFTRNVFALKVTGRSTFLTVNGDDNEIDHNTFRDKNTEGQMLFIQGPGTSMAKRNWVHHNAFLDFARSGRNNASGLHIGSSHRSMDPGFTVAEHNLFVRNVGENEGAICNKSTDAIYRYNTIIDSTELSLRHGHRVQVYGNFMVNSSGLRFFAHDHQIYSNYFENCRPAIAIGNGGATIPPGPLTSHQRPERVKVVFNTLVNNRANVQMGARNNGLGADDLVFANNIILGGNQAISIAGPLKDPRWEGNLIWKTENGAGDIPADGFVAADPTLVRGQDGVYRLSAGSPAIGKAAGAYLFVKVDLFGRLREGSLDVGAEQASDAAPTNRPLTESDVGPAAPEEPDRPLFAAPTATWITPGSEPQH